MQHLIIRKAGTGAILFLWLVCFYPIVIRGQSRVSKEIDSLNILFNKTTDEHKKIKILNDLGRDFISACEYEKAKQCADTVIFLTDKLDHKGEQAWAYNILGHIDRDQGRNAEALRNYHIALKLFEAVGYKKGYAISYHNFSIIHDAQGEYDDALLDLSKALKISEEIGYKLGIASAYVGIGKIYNWQGNYTGALEKLFSAQKIHEELGNTEAVSSCYYYIGMVYTNLKHYPEALKNLLKSLKIRKEAGELRTIAGSYHNIGVVYEKQVNYPEALRNHYAALRIQEKISDKLGMGNSYYAIGIIYMKQDKYAEALKNQLAALKIRKEISDKKGIAASYIAAGNTIFKQASATKTELPKAKYDVAIRFINKGILIAKQVGIKESVKNGYGYLAEIYGAINDYKKAFESNRLYISSNDSITNDETNRKLEQLRTEYEVETALAAEKAKQKIKDVESKTKLEKDKAEKKRKSESVIIGLSVLALGSVFVILMIRQRNLKRRAIDKAETGHKMAELELQSLRAQLNPHFMFNSLNAIQDLIVNENTDKSHLYLSRFSKLLRVLLDNANQPFVSVNQEMEFLELYLSLENLRIPDLKISIEMDPKLNTEGRIIPNMMLQPYIENAIWHGLSNKKGDRKLQIRIHENGNSTEFEIEDNGIGRKKAAELKKLYRKGHHSKGMELLSKRFNLLSKEYGSSIHTTITDLYENENATGTLVKIDVPISLSKQAKAQVNDTDHHS